MQRLWRCIKPKENLSGHSPLVVALNPSIDLEWEVDGCRPEEKNVILSERRWAGGKGVNVARWLHHFQQNPRLLLPSGGAPGREFRSHLRRENLQATSISIREPTRTNIIVTPPQGAQFRFNPPGPEIQAGEWKMILDAAAQQLPRSSCLILSGSLPREAPARTYARLVELARKYSVPVILDCDGPAFSQAATKQPFLVKPNRAELAAWARRALSSAADCLAAARHLSSVTRGWVLVSLGAAGGFLLNAPERLGWKAPSPATRARNTVGAGDALLAAATAQILARAEPAEWLRWGIAAGTASTGCPPGVLPKGSAIEALAGQVKIRRIDLIGGGRRF